MVIQIHTFLILLSSFSNQLDTKDTKIDNVAAIVQAVKVSGREEAYNFSVTLKSPDKGCEQYADWWEIISTDGKTLYYRRILGHSHVDEQPFTRSGGGVKITTKTEVIIRAHMHPIGYGSGKIAMKGSMDTGFKKMDIAEGFGKALELVAPLPDGCAF
jgi:hypothetical protein